MVPQARPQTGELRVLVLEDEVLIRIAIAEELRAHGIAVVETVNADEAWSYLQAGGRADLIFSDVRMPGSMDGVEFAHRVKAVYPEIQIVLTSGTAGAQMMMSSGRWLGHFLPKPYSFEQAARFIISILNSTQRQGF